jgi:hypothetical protein
MPRSGIPKVTRKSQYCARRRGPRRRLKYETAYRLQTHRRRPSCTHREGGVLATSLRRVSLALGQQIFQVAINSGAYLVLQVEPCDQEIVKQVGGLAGALRWRYRGGFLSRGLSRRARRPLEATRALRLRHSAALPRSTHRRRSPRPPSGARPRRGLDGRSTAMSADGAIPYSGRQNLYIHHRSGTTFR